MSLISIPKTVVFLRITREGVTHGLSTAQRTLGQLAHTQGHRGHRVVVATARQLPEMIAV
jgi:hypothetical protein